MRERDGERHVLARLVAGEADHHTLVACADQVDGIDAIVFRFLRPAHAHVDIGRLLLQADDHTGCLVVETLRGIVVADLLQHVACDVLRVELRGRGHFAEHNNQAGLGSRFTGDPPVRVLAENGVKDRIRNEVADFIGVTFGHRFGSQEGLVCAHECGAHCQCSFVRCELRCRAAYSRTR